MTIRVLIVDDQQLVRAGFRYLLDAEPDLTVVGEAGDGNAAIALVDDLDPDIVVMDIRMPGMDGIEATRRLTERGNRPAVLVLTTFDADVYVYDALRAGAGGFLLKDAPPEQLTAAVRTVAAGEALLAPSLTRRLVERFLEQPPASGVPSPRLESLTDRELEVLRLVARGRSNQEIATELFLAETTVKTHLSRVLHKTGCRDRLHLVVLGYETGLVRPGLADRWSPGGPDQSRDA